MAEIKINDASIDAVTDNVNKKSDQLNRTENYTRDSKSNVLGNAESQNTSSKRKNIFSKMSTLLKEGFSKVKSVANTHNDVDEQTAKSIEVNTDGQ